MKTKKKKKSFDVKFLPRKNMNEKPAAREIKHTTTSEYTENKMEAKVNSPLTAVPLLENCLLYYTESEQANYIAWLLESFEEGDEIFTESINDNTFLSDAIANVNSSSVSTSTVATNLPKQLEVTIL